MKNCCRQQVDKYIREQALSKLQEIAEYDCSISKENRKLLVAFIEGMK